MNFTEHNHKYFKDDGTVYTSVTTLLSKLKPEKDWEAILQKTAKKRKVDPEVLRAEWNKAKEDSCAKGTAFHEKKELELISTGYVSSDKINLPVVAPIWDNGIKKSNTLKLEPGVYPELLLWSDLIKVAGQADYVEVTKSGLLHVKDYKTNKKIEFKGFKSWDGKVEKMKFPVNHLDDCNGSVYALQLNFYAYMILRQNPKLKLGKLTLLHVVIDEKGNEKIIPYELPNLQKEIKTIFNLIKEGKL